MLLFGNFSLNLFIAVMLVLFLGMALHEYAHCIVANWWGDPTPAEHGRLTLNPLVHIYWPGWIMFALIGFGILGSAPINPRRMRDPRWGSFWATLAGPLSNLLLALVSGILLRLFFDPMRAAALFGVPDAVGSLPDFLMLLLFVSVFYNALLFVFNLLPLFPIDGWHIALALLPGYWLSPTQIPEFIRSGIPPLARFLERPAYKWQQWAQISQYVLLGLILLSFVVPGTSPLGTIIIQPTFALVRLFTGI